MELIARFYTTEAGGEPVRDWFKSLSKSDRHAMGEAVRLVQRGWPMGRPLCAPLGHGLYEVRKDLSDGLTGRVLFTFSGPNQITLLHAFIKKTQKTPQSDLDLARKRKAGR